MRKSRTFNLVITHLEQASTAHVRALLPQQLAGQIAAEQVLHLGQLTLLLQEAQQHRLTLYYLAEACYHGMRGTVPPSYEGETPYDPYQAMSQYLTGQEDTISCRRLSEDLQTYIAAMPPMACEQGLGTGSSCILPSHAFGELACGRAQLHQLAYYEQDLHQLATLVHQRAELRLVQELL